MSKYELKLSYNVGGGVIVGRHACGRSVNVALNREEYRPYKWGGFISYDMALSEPKTDYVFAACFQGNNGYREAGDYEWCHIGSGSNFFLIGLVDVDAVYGILQDHRPWVVHMKKYDNEALPIAHPEAPKPPRINNVYKLFGS